MYAQEQIKPYCEKKSKREQVEQMFDNIAHSYDVLNHTLSFGIDRYWRNCAIKCLKKSGKATRRILDIATGTGDFALLACRELNPDKVVGCDISDNMMRIGEEKVAEAGLSEKICFRKEDCSAMSFSDGSFDAVITAFALRNFENLDRCLQEMRRVIVSGGIVVAVDLCAPVSFPMKQLFYFYKKAVMPMVGCLFSHDGNAYTYLPETMDAVPQAAAMQEIFEKAGFVNVHYKRLAFGMCILYVAEKM
ncbi:MAG: bifunctional demethylmenaquinone methyltransferase/2-methoxy-6-polyprenyl-1,4-benzoquinol methylase UbiE [Bacteroides sp.]|nr:bifunctional demethylmenaquinone methyltransferase/2-methoxy-6-polyprenyl-1,4-benzoquinol methylase UbiE [Roseburia sp.]MCM1346573.1 bifunctional demethylmenaquinone methyltransferase/2-methoxy-6-polyprenyl-1,4-benzoquinol methylase UbiE [Bacteroides sp.]MCM1420549.1 bifunctional demethylmenaquinone methyltransferase/2-methoxy-6-polyprenyl-1,4-benzoquinol methylase UbiE [Bacteroides sp.]